MRTGVRSESRAKRHKTLVLCQLRALNGNFRGRPKQTFCSDHLHAGHIKNLANLEEVNFSTLQMIPGSFCQPRPPGFRKLRQNDPGNLQGRLGTLPVVLGRRWERRGSLGNFPPSPPSSFSYSYRLAICWPRSSPLTLSQAHLTIVKLIFTDFSREVLVSCRTSTSRPTPY